MLQTFESLGRRDVLVGAAVTLIAACVGCHRKDQPPTEIPTSEFEFKDLRRRIRKTISEKDRRKQTLELVDRAEKELQDIAKLFRDWRMELALLPAEERRTLEAQDRVTREINEKMQEHLMEICRVSLEARTVITEPEWNTIFVEADGGAAS